MLRSKGLIFLICTLFVIYSIVGTFIDKESVEIGLDSLNKRGMTEVNKYHKDIFYYDYLCISVCVLAQSGFWRSVIT